jgi:hypothetical protein
MFKLTKNILRDRCLDIESWARMTKRSLNEIIVSSLNPPLVQHSVFIRQTWNTMTFWKEILLCVQRYNFLIRRVGFKSNSTPLRSYMTFIFLTVLVLRIKINVISTGTSPWALRFYPHICLDLVRWMQLEPS